MTIIEGDYLKHVGVLGMKWGHRKPEESSKTSKSRSSKLSKKPTFEERMLGAAEPKRYVQAYFDGVTRN